MALTKTLYPDNEKLLLGTDGDLEIFSNNSTSIIDSTNQNLDLQSSGVINIKPGDASGIIAWNGAQVELYHNANKRLNTTADGVQLRGGSTKEHWCEGHLFPWTNSTYDIGGTAASDSSVYYWRDGLFSRNLILRGDSGEFRVEAANGVDAFTVDSDNGNTYIGGNLGIGVSPSKKLHVKGTDVALRLESTEATGRIGMEFYDTSAQKGFFGYPSSGNDHMAIQQNEAADLYFYVNGADRLHILSDGKVGIKEPTPGRNLTVKNGAHFGFEGTNAGYPWLGDTPVVAISTDGNNGSATSYADKAILLVGRGGGGAAGSTYGGVGVTTELFRVDMGGNVHVKDGDLKIGASHGISFDPHDAAVSSPGSDSNLLDDYEEGTFTPIFTTGGSAFSTDTAYSVQNGEYTKVGNLVTCNIYLGWNNGAAGGSGTLRIAGLPFPMSSHATYTGVSFGWQYWNHQGMNQHNYITAYGQSGQSYAVLLYQRTYNGSAGNTDWGATYTAVDATFAHNEGSFSCTISYHV